MQKVFPCNHVIMYTSDVVSWVSRKLFILRHLLSRKYLAHQHMSWIIVGKFVYVVFYMFIFVFHFSSLTDLCTNFKGVYFPVSVFQYYIGVEDTGRHCWWIIFTTPLSLSPPYVCTYITSCVCSWFMCIYRYNTSDVASWVVHMLFILRHPFNRTSHNGRLYTWD